MWLYYAPSNVTLWPQSWGFRDIQTSHKIGDEVVLVGLNYTDLAAMPGEIVVTDPPFLWTPQPLSGGMHYCLVAFAENPPLSQPPSSPAPAGAFGTWDELAAFVVKTPNMAWRNTILVSREAPTWTVQAPVAGAPGGGQFSLGYQCEKMPIGSFIEVSVPGPDPDNSIYIPRKEIKKPNDGLMIPLIWPENYNSYINITFWKENTSPATGANVQPAVAYPYAALVEKMPELVHGELAHTYRQPVEILGYDSPKMESASVKTYYILGSIPYQFD